MAIITPVIIPSSRGKSYNPEFYTQVCKQIEGSLICESHLSEKGEAYFESKITMGGIAVLLTVLVLAYIIYKETKKKGGSSWS